MGTDALRATIRRLERKHKEKSTPACAKAGAALAKCRKKHPKFKKRKKMPRVILGGPEITNKKTRKSKNVNILVPRRKKK